MRSIKPTFNGVNTLALLIVAAVSGCATDDNTRLRPHQEVKIETAPVLVATGCIDEQGRPAKPQTLKQRYTPEQWAALPPGAKAQAARAQSGTRMNYEDDLDAATSACK